MKLKNLLIWVSVVGRLMPHPFNFTPVGAMALVGSAKLGPVWRWITPFAALIVSHVILNHTLYGFKDWFAIVPFVYASFAINILLGVMLQKSKRLGSFLLMSLIGSTQFFAVTNFGTWAVGHIYPRTWEGFATCYAMALPFFERTLVGDMLWCAALYFAFEKISVWVAQKQTASVL